MRCSASDRWARATSPTDDDHVEFGRSRFWHDSRAMARAYCFPRRRNNDGPVSPYQGLVSGVALRTDVTTSWMAYRSRHPAGSSFCSHGQGRYELDRFIDAGEGKLCGFVDGPDEIAVVCLEQAETARLARYQHASDIANSRAVSAKPASTLNHSVLRNAELLHR